MNTKFFSALIAASGLLTVATSAQTPVATPATPAPMVISTPTPMPAAAAAAPSPSRIVYSPRLPSPTELMNVAAAQGLSVERIDQTDSRINVTYRASDGTPSVVMYQLLPTAASAVTTPTTTTVVTTVAPTRVVYTRPDPFFYYDEPYYSPWGYRYYSPVSVNLGFGFGYGYRGGHYRGGFHHRGRW